ncbi:MAG: hypothetical protein ACI945_000119 [Pseudohongiellaceae bacterium]|jgi:hypothetical protein
MKTIMSLEQLITIDAIGQFLEGTQAVAFNVATNKHERYRWVQKTLVKHRYITWQSRQRNSNSLSDEGDWLLPGPDEALDTAIRQDR